MYNPYMFNPYLMSDDVFGLFYNSSHIRKKRNILFRHLEKHEKGYRRKK